MAPTDGVALRKTLFEARLARLTQGLLSAGLLPDIQGGVVTLLAPTDAAFLGLPWTFDELMFDERLLEARFDLFEYLVIRGRAPVRGTVSEPYVTMQGEAVRLGGGRAHGRFGSARVLRTIDGPSFMVHVLDRCIYPWDPGMCQQDAASSS